MTGAFNNVRVNVIYDTSRQVDAGSAHDCLRALGALVTLTCVEADESTAKQSGLLYCFRPYPPYCDLAPALVSALAHVGTVVAVDRQIGTRNGGFDFSLWLTDSTRRSRPAKVSASELPSDRISFETCKYCRAQVRSSRYAKHLSRVHSDALAAGRWTRTPRQAATSDTAHPASGHGRCRHCGDIAILGDDICYRCI